MRAYVGQTRAADLVASLQAAGIGECTNRGEFPPRRRPWFYDNGAYVDWKAGRKWDAGKWYAEFDEIRGSGLRPDFAVAPDVVAGGLESLRRSTLWLPRMTGVDAYLAVQDGMGVGDVAGAVAGSGFKGLFVGGTLEWKLATGAMWCRVAKEWGLRCHIGRVGVPNRVRWAKAAGADSIDSCFPLWSKARLDEFVRCVYE